MTAIGTRVVAVTGASGVLGSAVVSRFVEEGTIVCRIDRAPLPPGDDAFGDVDISDPTAASAVVQAIASRHGRLDVLVNVAGGFEWETLAAGSIETWDRLYSMNVRTAVCASQAALPWIVKAPQGRIVNIAAAASTRGSSGMGAYAASKAGVVRFTEALADEWKASSMTVNALLPTIIDTPRNRHDMPQADFAKWVTPGDIAGIVGFLASEAAAAITGAAILVGARSL